MNIDYFNLEELKNRTKNKAPKNDLKKWVQFWNGNYCLRESFSSRTLKQYNEITKNALTDNNAYYLEVFVFLSLMKNFNKDKINFIELGSGRAPWCLTVASCVDNLYIDNNIKEYKILALEAEKKHYLWGKEHLEAQCKNGKADTIHGAIWSENRTLNFDDNGDSADWMGQSVKEWGQTEVQAYSIDYLIQKYDFDNIDIIHMDVQGAEVEAIKGAQNAIENNKIDYLLIATHGDEIEEELQNILKDKYELLLSIKNKQESYIESLDKTFKSNDDGFFVFKSKKVK